MGDKQYDDFRWVPIRRPVHIGRRDQTRSKQTDHGSLSDWQIAVVPLPVCCQALLRSAGDHRQIRIMRSGLIVFQVYSTVSSTIRTEGCDSGPGSKSEPFTSIIQRDLMHVWARQKLVMMTLIGHWLIESVCVIYCNITPQKKYILITNYKAPTRL